MTQGIRLIYRQSEKSDYITGFTVKVKLEIEILDKYRLIFKGDL